MIRPASSSALRELLRVIGDALQVDADERPGAVLVVSAGVWSALRVVVNDDYSATSVRWATNVLRLLGRGPPDAA
jgi:hypothetical protein